MDQFMVDVSDIDCNINDEVVIVGAQNASSHFHRRIVRQRILFQLRTPLAE